MLLKDAHGTTQLVIDSKESPSLKGFVNVPPESVVHIAGTVTERPKSQIKPVSPLSSEPLYYARSVQTLQGPAGDIEIAVENFTVLNPSDSMPFYPSMPFNVVCQ